MNGYKCVKDRRMDTNVYSHVQSQRIAACVTECERGKQSAPTF